MWWSRVSIARAVIAASVLSLSLPARAAPLVVLFGGIRGQGLEDDVERATGQAVLEQLELLNIRTRPLASAGGLRPECLARPDCVKELTTGQDAAAILDVYVIRIGPLMQLTIRIFDGHTGLGVVDLRATAPRRGFPENYSFEAALSQGFDSVRRIRGLDPEPAADSVPPPPPPPRPVVEVLRDDGPTIPRAATEDEELAPWPLISGALAGIGGVLFLSGAGAGIWWLALDQTLSQSCQEGCVRDDFGQVHDQFIISGWAAPLLFGAGTVALAGGMIGLVAQTRLGDKQ